MRNRGFAICEVLVLLAAAPSAAWSAPIFNLMARGDDAFPGRAGYVYDDRSGSPFVGARSNDPLGDIYFQAAAKAPDGSSVTDLMVYRRATRTVEPYARSGEVVDGSPTDMIWGAVGGAQPGVISHVGVIQDGSANGRRAVLVSRPDGSRFVAAVRGQPAPGYSPPATLSTVGLASPGFNDVNMNSNGVVSYGARFRDENNTLRYGYYLTRPNGSPERIIDSTMPVPGRPAAQWVAYDGVATPFDIYTPGLDADGNAYFRAKYRDGGNDYRVFYKRATDGTLSAIADSGAATPLPGLPGHTYSRFRTAANNQRGDVAFSADINASDGSAAGAAVFAQRAGKSLTKVLATSDPVPGIPEATNHTPGLIAMNESGHLLLTANYALAGLGGQSLVLYNPDGAAEPVLRFDQTPGFPGQRAGSTIAADLNTRGDAIFITRMNMAGEVYAAFAYLNGKDQLMPILKTGDTLDGLTVVSFGLGGGADDPLGSIGASGGPVAWDDQRNFSLNVTLRDASGRLSYSLYAVQAPEPTAAAMMMVGAMTFRRRGW